jgi:ATP-binding cassette subfamily G (WHITE) protein 2
MYAGDCDAMVEWFSSVGFEYSPAQHGVVSDWALDLVSCSKAKPAHAPGAPSISSRREVRALSGAFVEHWMGRRAARLKADLRALAALQAARRAPPRCTPSRGPSGDGGSSGRGSSGRGSSGGGGGGGGGGRGGSLEFGGRSTGSGASSSSGSGSGSGGSSSGSRHLPWWPDDGGSSPSGGSGSGPGRPARAARRAAAALPGCALDAERAARLAPPTWRQMFRWAFFREFIMITRNPAEVAGRTLTNTWVAVTMGMLYYGIPADAAFLRCKVNILLNVSRGSWWGRVWLSGAACLTGRLARAQREITAPPSLCSPLTPPLSSPHPTPYPTPHPTLHPQILAFFCLMPYLSMSLYTAGKATYLADVSAKLYTPSAYYLAKVRGGQ